MSDELTIERLKRSANANLGAAYWEKKRGDTYRARALTLHRKIRRDTAIEKKWEEMYEQQWDQMLSYTFAAGIPHEGMSPADRVRTLAERVAAAEAENKRLKDLLADGKDCFAWHTVGCLGDIPDHPCLCGYVKWRDDVHAVQYPAAPAQVAP